MEANMNLKKAKNGGAGLIALRALPIVLIVIMALAFMPWIAPKSGQANAVTKLQWPVGAHKYTITKGRHFSAGHKGIDISGTGNAYVYAAAGGKVIKIYNCGKKHFGSYHNCNGFGTGVVIKGNDKRVYQYAHMLGGSIPTKVYKGAKVAKGQIVGQVGTTGNSSGTHLHFGISSKGNSPFDYLINPESSTFKYNKKTPDFNQYPFGYLSKCETHAGTLSVWGWAYDPDMLSGKKSKIEVRVYIKSGGKYTYIGSGVANVNNTTAKNANKKFKCGAGHAFAFTLKTSNYWGYGTKSIYVTGVNISKSGKAAGNNAFLHGGGKKVNFKKVAKYNAITCDAKNVENKSATLVGKIDPSGNMKSWGFYLGTSEADMAKHKYTVSKSTTNSKNMVAKAENYVKDGELQPGTKYYYKVFANIDGKEITDSKYKTFATKSDKPGIPVLKVDEGSEEIGIGDSPVFKWTTEELADYYKLYIYDEEGNEVSVVDNIVGDRCSAEGLQKAGTYTAQVESYNSVGTREKSDPVSFVVKPNVVVTYVDANDFVDVKPPEEGNGSGEGDDPGEGNGSGEGNDPGEGNGSGEGDDPGEGNGSGEGDDSEEGDASDIGPVLAVREVAWGHNANPPTDPAHNGYTFKEWSDDAKGVTENTTIEAVYDINTYTATFVDSSTGETLDTQEVEYFSAAEPPAYSLPTRGIVKLGYDGWDKDYECITEDTTFHTCSGDNAARFPIEATITNAVREYDAESSEDEGYTVTINLQNWDQGTTKGRAVVALKTEEGKLLTSTESAAFSLKRSTEKEIEVFVPYGNAASIAEVFVIGQYKDVIPISKNTDFEIDQSSTMTAWSEEDPGDNVPNKETRVEYRYRDKQTTTSYNTSLAGYTQSGSSWVTQSSGNIDYVTSFPSGFNKSSSLYTKYNGVKPKTYSETATERTRVSTSTIAYIYWHWCRGYTGGPTNRLVSDCKEGDYTHWHAYRTTSPLSFDNDKKSFYKKYPDVCKDSYWWMTTYANKSTQLPVKRCSYTIEKKLFNYYKWLDWSEWSTTPATESANKQVETRTVYRYQTEGAMQEDTSGEVKTVTGNVGASFAGKEATLFVYKVNEASDFTNEYVGQTVIDEDGKYSFSFKLREYPDDPALDIGDLTVALGIEGTNAPIFLDNTDFRAPKKTYTVNYYDYDADLQKDPRDPPLYSVQVEEHGDAPLPDESTLVEDGHLQREGYTFTNWSGSNMNVTEDRDLIAEYKINTYNVVFVDWKAKSVSVEKFDWGAPLTAPQAEDPGEGQTVEWDAIADGVQTVTEDMIVTTRYKDVTLNVQVLNEGAKGPDTYDGQDVKYGTAVELPEIQSTETKEFQGWEDVSGESPEGLEDTVMTTNAILCPVYTFNETVANPTASLEQGVYNTTQTVTLSCETPGAEIYYTLDGSDPTDLNSTHYTGPFEITGPVELKFYAAKFEMNNSEIQRCLYSVNYDGATSEWMLEEDLPEEVADDWIAHGVQRRTGYRYKDSMTITTLAEQAALEASGWTTDSEAEATYDEFSDWSDSLPADIDEYIDVDIESKPVYTTANKFTYSHYVYVDGVTKYAPQEVDGFVCDFEETEAFDEPLNVAGKDENGNWFYSYDGQVWYNQQETSGQVQTGTKYRWRHQTVKLTKWSDWTTSAPGADEEREYESAEVFNYLRPNTYIVTVHLGEDTWSYLAKEGSLASVEDPDPQSEESASFMYDVAGVYTDADYNNEWNLETDTITGPIDLFVKTETKSYDVYFMDDDSTIVYEEETEDTNETSGDNEALIISKQTVPYGESAEEPQAPTKAGYVFVGWDTDSYKSVKNETYVYAQYVSEEEYATVTLDQEELTLNKGDTANLTAMISPLAQSETERTWTSSNEEVATVSDEGEVTAMGKGTAEITVKLTATRETATCTVTVLSDNSDSLVIITNDKVKVDQEGYLRGVKGGTDTFADIKAYFDNADLVCVDANGDPVADDDFVGTGYKIRLMADTEVRDEIEVIVTGDINMDGSVSNLDVSMLLRRLMGKIELSEVQIRAADANGDGEVWNSDAILISRSLVGKAVLP